MPVAAVPSRTTPLRALIVEDNPLDAELIAAILRHAGWPVTAVRVDTREAFLKELKEKPDIVLCDYKMPAFSAADAIDLVKAQGLDTPVIIISGSIGEETAVEMIKRGADDYLLKDRLGRLSAAIEHALEQQTLRTATRRAEEELRQSEFKYRCLFDHLLDAAYLCDAGTLRIIDTNLQGERLLGLDRAAILGLRLSQFLPLPVIDRLRALNPDQDDPAVRLASETHDVQGRHIPVQVNATVLTIHHHPLMLVLLRNLGSDPVAEGI
jgi:PAS domain S-box-containing protein